jgi:hypothetical protein
MENLRLEYSENKFLSRRKKRLSFSIGVIALVFGLLVLIFPLSSSFSLSMLISAIANIFLGTFFILQALEHKLLYPIKYIDISSNCIEYKLGRFYNTNKIEWDSIERISKKKNSLNFYSGNKIISLKMMHFPSSDEKRIKSKISIIAENKGKVMN